MLHYNDSRDIVVIRFSRVLLEWNGDSVKALRPGEKRIGGILVPFASPQELDTDGEYFDARTKGVDFFFKSVGAMPSLAHHNRMRDLLTSAGIAIPKDAVLEVPVGRIDVFEKTEKGWYAEAILGVIEKYADWYDEYIEALYAGAQAGKLKWSGGAMPITKSLRRSPDGHIKSAFVWEGSLTPTPAKPYSTRISALEAAYKSLGLELPAALDDEESPAGENPQDATVPEWLIEKALSVDETTRKLYETFVNRERAIAESEGRFPAYPVERYDDHLIVEHGRNHYRVPYTADMQFAPYATWTQVKREWMDIPREATKAIKLARAKRILMELSYDSRS
jgi:hypothetical protein